MMITFMALTKHSLLTARLWRKERNMSKYYRSVYRSGTHGAVRRGCGMHFGSSSDQAQPSLLGTILGIIGIIGFLLLLLGEVIK